MCREVQLIRIAEVTLESLSRPSMQALCESHSHRYAWVWIPESRFWDFDFSFRQVNHQIFHLKPCQYDLLNSIGIRKNIYSDNVCVADPAHIEKGKTASVGLVGFFHFCDEPVVFNMVVFNTFVYWICVICWLVSIGELPPFVNDKVEPASRFQRRNQLFHVAVFLLMPDTVRYIMIQ